MQRLLFLCALLVACGSSSPSPGDDDTTTPDAGSGSSSGGQHVTECTGVVESNAPSNCPKGDCDDNHGDTCTAYASFVPGASAGLCNAGETGTYGLVFGTVGSSFSEVIECTSGTAKQHACASGFSTVASSYNGQPGYMCL